MTTALAVSAELLRFGGHSHRGQAWMDVLAHASPGVEIVETHAYRGGAEWLLFWGPGAPDRFEPMRQQLAAGGHVAAFDLAYYHRDRKVRVSIDGAHPAPWVMRKDWPSSRFEADRIRLEHRWDPKGPVIVAGIGRKARVQYGTQVADWEENAIAASRFRWPSRQVRYRRKQQDAPIPAGVALTSDREIDTVLTGASLVITWHSNVAVDAMRLGIPVICRDGAAAAVCPSWFSESDPQPVDEATRWRFFANLAHFQYASHEAEQCWQFLREMVS